MSSLVTESQLSESMARFEHHRRSFAADALENAVRHARRGEHQGVDAHLEHGVDGALLAGRVALAGGEEEAVLELRRAGEQTGDDVAEERISQV